MKKKTTSLIILFFLFVVMVASFFWQTPFDYLEQLIKDNSILSVFSFIFLMIISEVVAPVTVLPLVPVAALFFGPFFTAIFSFIFSYGYQIFFLENIFAVVLTGVFLISLLSLVFYFHKKGRI